MLLYLFFDSSLPSYPKKTGTEKWPKTLPYFAIQGSKKKLSIILKIISIVILHTYNSKKLLTVQKNSMNNPYLE